MGGRGGKSRKTTGQMLVADQQQRNKGITFPEGRGRYKDYNATANGTSKPKWDAHVKMNAAYDNWQMALSGGEKTALKEYQEWSYATVNHDLRSNGGVPLSTGSQVTMLQSALDKASLPESVITYRGINSSITYQDALKLVGTTEVDHGFTSTSLFHDSATWFTGAASEDHPQAIYRFHLPKGAKAAYINAATEPGGPYETEMLVQRGGRYKISGVQKLEVNGKHYVVINANYIGQTQYSK